jgi:hypothetical protein
LVLNAAHFLLLFGEYAKRTNSCLVVLKWSKTRFTTNLIFHKYRKTTVKYTINIAVSPLRGALRIDGVDIKICTQLTNNKTHETGPNRPAIFFLGEKIRQTSHLTRRQSHWHKGELSTVTLLEKPVTVTGKIISKAASILRPPMVGNN